MPLLHGSQNYVLIFYQKNFVRKLYACISIRHAVDHVIYYFVPRD